jgi:hypothetical protein
MSRTEFKFGVLMPIGPGPDEPGRLRDTVSALEFFESGNFCLVIVDDGKEDRDFGRVVSELGPDRVTVMKNPRRGRGRGWEGACTSAVLGSLGHLADANVEFVLKLDSDALVIAPFADQIISRFAGDSSVGMLGSRYYADGTEPDREWVRSVAVATEKLMRPFALWRRTRVGFFPAVQTGLFGRYKRIRNTIRSAFVNGYRVGDHCQGGGYALSRGCLKALERHGHLDDPCTWLPTPVPADDVQALCVKAVGLHFRDFSGDGEPFACHWRGLPDSPENLLRRGAAIIHSLKDHAGRTEAQTRAFFRALRNRKGDAVYAGQTA